MEVEPTYILRDATADDAADIAEIFNESIAAGAALDEEPKDAEEIEKLIAGFGKRETILILEGGQRALGWGIIKRYGAFSGYRFCCETAVYLRSDEVEKGYGSYIERAMITRCHDYGYHHLAAKVPAGDKRGIEAHLSLGFQMVGIQKEIGFRDGRWLDVAILQLVLADVAPEIPVKYA